MIINGVSIHAITEFVKGIEFEKDDFLYYKGNLYIVNSRYIGSIAPSNAPECQLYIEKVDKSTIANASTIISKLSQYLDGIRAAGFIGRITTDSIDNIRRTCVYQIMVNTSHVAPYSFNGIFRCYSLGEGNYVQEIVDYGDENRSPNLFYRSCTDGGSYSGWTPLATLNGSSDLDNFGQYLRTISDKISKIVSDAEEVNELVFTAPFKILKPDMYGNYVIGNKPCTLSLVIGYLENGIRCQESLYADPNSLTSDEAVSLVSPDRIIRLTKLGAGSTTRVKITAESDITILKVLQIQG